jgi:hypothetical protein
MHFRHLSSRVSNRCMYISTLFKRAALELPNDVKAIEAIEKDIKGMLDFTCSISKYPLPNDVEETRFPYINDKIKDVGILKSSSDCRPTEQEQQGQILLENSIHYHPSIGRNVITLRSNFSQDN